MVHVSKSVTINRPRAEVYEFWRDLDNLPRFMIHLKEVTYIAPRQSHWCVHGPAGTSIEWDAEMTDDRPGELLAWRSLPGADVPNEGRVQFSDAPGDRGTEIHVDLSYDPPAGKLGALVARLFGEEPAQQLRDDLRRFKQVLETGEVVLSDGSAEGAGQGPLKQRAAQPADAETAS